ncbi:MAG: pyridoxine 5'-phosphate synthase [Pseudomonadota bacterium]
MILLGVNVDHVATIRQARNTEYPDPIAAAKAAVLGGADQITIHLREDRRHIQDMDVVRMRSEIDCLLNLEMAALMELVNIACEIKPDTATLVPERRLELTTEGGLDVLAKMDALKPIVQKLTSKSIAVSLFIDPDEAQVNASVELGVKSVELHTGAYCDAKDNKSRNKQLDRLKNAASLAKKYGLKVCAGHGINYDNAEEIAEAMPEVVEYNIGHAIVAHAIFVGMERAVREMKKLLVISNQ